MLVCASKKMNDLLNKTYKKSGFIFSYEKLSRRQYAVYVDCDLYRHENDYLIDCDMFRVIRLSYPDEYYAMPLYITTNLLLHCFKNSNGSLSDFLDILQDEITI